MAQVAVNKLLFLLCCGALVLKCLCAFWYSSPALTAISFCVGGDLGKLDFFILVSVLVFFSYCLCKYRILFILLQIYCPFYCAFYVGIYYYCMQSNDKTMSREEIEAFKIVGSEVRK